MLPVGYSSPRLCRFGALDHDVEGSVAAEEGMSLARSTAECGGDVGFGAAADGQIPCIPAAPLHFSARARHRSYLIPDALEQSHSLT